MRLRHRARHQAPDGRLLRPAAGPGMLWSVLPFLMHGGCPPSSITQNWSDHGQVSVHGGPFPLWRGIVLRLLQGLASGGGQGANTCERCQTDVRSLRCAWIHRRAAAVVPAWPCEGICAPSMRRCNTFSSVRLRGPAGGSGQGHAATWEHCAHLLAPVAWPRTPCRTLRRGGRCVGGGRTVTRGRGREAGGRPTVGEGSPGVPAGVHRHGAGSPYRAFSVRPLATFRQGGSRGLRRPL